MDGRSLIKIASEGTDSTLESRPLYQYYPFYDLRWGLTPNASIRLGDYKLIEFFGDRVDANNQYVPGNHLELYNLKTDLSESHNLALSEPDRVNAMRGQLRQWIASIDAKIPTENAHHDPARAFVETREKPPWLKDKSHALPSQRPRP